MAEINFNGNTPHDTLDTGKESQSTTSLLDLVYTLLVHRKFIFFSTLAAGIVVLAITYSSKILPADHSMNLMPNSYKTQFHPSEM